jgi:UDP-N-acetyl-D-mannosaminuronic acid dehydrogenase
VVSRLEDRFNLGDLTVGILGMAFKGGSDDPRESLAYKLRKILMLKTRETLCTDPYVVDDRLVSLDEVLKRADLLVIAAPHQDYAALDTDKPVVDMWGLTGQGVRI